ncbi:MAG: glycerate kinase [Synergistes sp.]|nr:glycerate kinase [Synergistes sp.]
MADGQLRSDALDIFLSAVKDSLPDTAVRKALEKCSLPERIIVIAIGKAAWRMAKTAVSCLASKEIRGAVITKYGHSCGPIEGLKIFEAGHPVSDANTFAATEYILKITEGLSEDDHILFLVSGGGSALFEKPLPGVTPAEIADLNSQLLRSGADINEINTVRKRFSAVKGGRFAEHCSPARIHQIILSDVLGDDLSSIASGPAVLDHSAASEARALAEKYSLNLSSKMTELLDKKPPASLDNVSTTIAGSVRELCSSAVRRAKELGYDTYLITDDLRGEAKEASELLVRHIRMLKDKNSSRIRPCALIMGGETTVTVKGSGKGGRNQELALHSAKLISGMENTLILSAGSDGTDGPTDAAGGIVDGGTWNALEESGIAPLLMLQDNDSYNALKACGGLVVTGPTGTNVNDLTLALCV